MRVTIQYWAESGNWACPTGEDVEHFDTLDGAVNSGFFHHVQDVGRYDDARCAGAFIWRGHSDDVTDLYPDYEIRVGPRGGYVVSRA